MMKNQILILLLALPLMLSAQDTLLSPHGSIPVHKSLADDSLFHAQIVEGRLTDSTDIDRIKTLYVDAIRYKSLSKASGNREYLLQAMQNLNLSIHIQDSLGIPAPLYYAASSFQLGLFYLNAQSSKAAYFYFTQAHRYDPKNTNYLEYLVYMNENSDDPKQMKQAIKDLKYLSKQHPYNSTYCYHLFEIYANSQKYKEAKKELDKYKIIEGESLTTLQYELYLLKYSNHDSDIIPRIKRYIDDNPMDRSRAEMLMASSYISNYDYDNAFKLLYRNLDHVNDYNLEPLLNPYISTYLERSDTIGICHLLDTLITLHPSDADVLNYAIKVYDVLNDTASMMIVLHRACSLDNANEQAYSTLYQIYAAREMKDSLRILGARGHQLFHNDDWAYKHIISVAFDSTLTDSLISLCHQVIGSSETPAMKGVAYMFLGDTYMQRDSLRLAFAAYDSCIIYTPDNSYALNNYSYTLATSPEVTAEDLARAEKMAAKALKLDASSAAIIDTYAWILFLRDDAISAKMYYERLIRMAEEGETEFDAVNCWHIYSVFQKLQMPEANAYLLKAKEFYRNNPSSVKDQKIIDILSK